MNNTILSISSNVRDPPNCIPKFRVIVTSLSLIHFHNFAYEPTKFHRIAYNQQVFHCEVPAIISMAVVLKALARAYSYLYYDLRGKCFDFAYFYCSRLFTDKRTDDFWLVNTPFPVLGILGLYYYFVTDFGPRFMKDRPPFELKRIMILYNIGQILLNGYIVLQVKCKTF